MVYGQRNYTISHRDCSKHGSTVDGSEILQDPLGPGGTKNPTGKDLDQHIRGLNLLENSMDFQHWGGGFPFTANEMIDVTDDLGTYRSNRLNLQ